MFIDIKLLDGSNLTITAEAVIRFRPSFGANEPKDTTMVDYGAKSPLFTRASVENLRARLGQHLQLTRLTTPNGVPIHLDGRKVSSISEASDAGAEGAKSKLTVGGRVQFVRETPAQVQALIGGGPGIA